MAVAAAIASLCVALGALHWGVVHPARGTAFSNVFSDTCILCHGGTAGRATP